MVDTPDAYTITAARALLGPIGEVLPDPALVVKGREIAWVGPAAELPVDYRTLPAMHYPGATLSPGFVDAHVHLVFPVAGHFLEIIEAMKGADDEQLRQLVISGARRLLAGGVTTARDLGGRSFVEVAVRDAIEAGELVGARLLVATRPITTPRGHLWYMGGTAVGEREVRDAVRLNHERGADWIKVTATGGFMTIESTPWETQFTDDELLALVDEAHSLGMRVAAHCHGTAGIEQAVMAGVDTIEHCSFILGPRLSVAETKRIGVPAAIIEFDEGLAKRIAAAGIVVSPTLGQPDVEQLRRELPPAVAVVGRLRECGVTIVSSTDAGHPYGPGYFAEQLIAHTLIGFPPEEIMYNATTGSARALGIDSVTGALAAGLSADVIVIAGDPLADITSVRDVDLVVVRGRPHTLAELADADGER